MTRSPSPSISLPPVPQRASDQQVRVESLTAWTATTVPCDRRPMYSKYAVQKQPTPQHTYVTVGSVLTTSCVNNCQACSM